MLVTSLNGNIMAANFKEIVKRKHHEQQNICASRCRYRQGRKDTAVKVYTVNQESKHLILLGVPAVGARSELEDLCNQFGVVEELYPLDEYPCEEFTETFYLKYQTLRDSRFAKKKLDNHSFFGGILHVCYGPEFETIQDTREKLQERRKLVAARTRGADDHSGSDIQSTQTKRKYDDTSFRREVCSSDAQASKPTNTQPNTVTYIWAGQSYTVECEPQPQLETNEIPSNDLNTNSTFHSEHHTTAPFIPRQLHKPRTVVSSPASGSSIDQWFSGNSSVNHTAARIRSKLDSTSVAPLEVTWKRRKKI